MNIVEFLLDSYDEIFPPDGFDNLNCTINGEASDFKSERVQSFKKSKLTRWSTFLGIANRELKAGEEQSLLNLYHNFFGINPYASDLQNIVRLFLLTPVNVITTPFKFFRNILKLVTELLPYLGLKLSQKLQSHLIKQFSTALSEKNLAKKIFYCLVIGTFLLLNNAIFYQSFDTLLDIGRAITSPIMGILIAWHSPKKLEKPIDEALKENQTSKITRIVNLIVITYIKVNNFKIRYQKYLDVMAVIFSITMTMLTYSIVIPYLVLASGPFVAANLPLLANSVNWLMGILSPVLSNIGQAILPFAEPLVDVLVWDLYPPIVAMTSVIGLSFIAGALTTTLGTGIHKLTEIFRNWWWKNPANVNNNTEASNHCPGKFSPWHVITNRLFNQTTTKVTQTTNASTLPIESNSSEQQFKLSNNSFYFFAQKKLGWSKKSDKKEKKFSPKNEQPVTNTPEKHVLRN